MWGYFSYICTVFRKHYHLFFTLDPSCCLGRVIWALHNQTASLARDGSTGAKCWLFCGLLNLTMDGVTPGKPGAVHNGNCSQCHSLLCSSSHLLAVSCTFTARDFPTGVAKPPQVCLSKKHIRAPQGVDLLCATTIIKILLCVLSCCAVLARWMQPQLAPCPANFLGRSGVRLPQERHRAGRFCSQKLTSNFQGTRREVTTELPFFYWVSLNSQFKWAKATGKHSEIVLFTEVVVP